MLIKYISKKTYRSINYMSLNNNNPEPTVVLYKSNICRHCTALSSIWDTPPNKDEDSVVTALKKVYPKLRFYILTAKDNTGKFDENVAPKDLIRYGKWYPMILLIPGVEPLPVIAVSPAFLKRLSIFNCDFVIGISDPKSITCLLFSKQS